MRNRISSSVQLSGRNQHRLGEKDLLDLSQSVGNQRPAGGDDVEDGVGDVGCRGDFHRTGDHLDAGLDALLLQPALQDAGVGGGDALALEPLRTVIVHGLGDGQGDAAAAEAEFLLDLDVEAALLDLVQAHDAQSGGAAGHDLRNVVVAHIEDFQGEVRGLGQEFPARIVDVDPDLAQQGGALLVEAALGLDG